MSLRCPLCLEPLERGTQFYRFCPRHPHGVQAFTVSDDDYGGIYCADLACHPRASALDENVFLLHEDCRCLNPYWDGNIVDLSRPMSIQRGNRQVVVSHWELGLLQQAAKAYKDRKEMWFPQILFRAVNEYWRDQPFGALILLAGAQRCGKTVLSLMAMNRGSYDPKITTDHFVHVTQPVPASPPEHLLRTMDALDVLRRSVPPSDFCASSEILATNAEDLSNLKSSYLWLKSPPSKRKDTGQAKMGAWDLLIHVLSTFLPPRGPAGLQVLDRVPSHLVLALFDTAGELWQKNDPRLLALRARTDTMAVVLDATSLSHSRNLKDPRTGTPVPEDSPDSVSVSCQWLENAGGSAPRRCLVVTKLDMLEDDPDVKAHLEAIRDSRTPPETPRNLLLKWLSRKNQIENRLRHLIEDDTDLPVFFVWTEGLNDTGRMPETFGLGGFVNWCVDAQRWMGTGVG